MLLCTTQAVCQHDKPFKLRGFFRSTAGDGCFRAVLPHQGGASFAIAVQQRVVPDISPEELAEVFEATLATTARGPHGWYAASSTNARRRCRNST